MSELNKSRLQDAAYMAGLVAECEKEIQKGIIGQSEIIRKGRVYSVMVYSEGYIILIFCESAELSGGSNVDSYKLAPFKTLSALFSAE